MVANTFQKHGHFVFFEGYYFRASSEIRDIFALSA
jgi:hypothetical protein